MPGEEPPSPIPFKLCPPTRRDVDNPIDQSKNIFWNKLYCGWGVCVLKAGTEALSLLRLRIQPGTQPRHLLSDAASVPELEREGTWDPPCMSHHHSFGGSRLLAKHYSLSAFLSLDFLCCDVSNKLLLHFPFDYGARCTGLTSQGPGPRAHIHSSCSH